MSSGDNLEYVYVFYVGAPCAFRTSERILNKQFHPPQKLTVSKLAEAAESSWTCYASHGLGDLNSVPSTFSKYTAFCGMQAEMSEDEGHSDSGSDHADDDHDSVLVRFAFSI